MVCGFYLDRSSNSGQLWYGDAMQPALPPGKAETDYADDGSVILRWFGPHDDDEIRRYWERYPGATVSDLESGKVPAPYSWSSPTAGDQSGMWPFVVEVQVWFDGSGQATSVRVTPADGVSPTALHRFSWSRLLAVADAANRTRPRAGQTLIEHVRASEPLGTAVREVWGEDQRPRRPGRKGHPETFYKAVADRYLALRMEGVTDPTAQLAKEREANRSTVAGWVSAARLKGYLPQARRGRAG